ncbi:hypothetical protein DK412_04485 [Methylobacterium sp. 17Sr1-1]|nr:hypothetical protein DK412_04485 [Methylobacterium sp. 17Sr1-1]
MPSGIHQHHARAPDHLLGPVVAPQSAYPDTLDALGVDDRQPRMQAAAEAPLLAAGQDPPQDLEQPLLNPAPDPAVDRAPWHRLRVCLQQSCTDES